MQVHEQRKGAVLVVRPEEAVLAAGADALAAALRDALARALGRVVIDASAVPFVDSRGLEVLLDLSDELAQRGQGLKLCGVTPTLRDVLALTGLESQFEFYDDATAAARSFL